MGKKKKGQRGQKDKKVVTTNPKTVPLEQNLKPEQVSDATIVVKERKGCAHLDKSMDLTKVCSKIELAEGFKCDDCREGALDRKAGKGKGKQGKKKGNESKGIWVCLECGHFACGGVGLPTTNQTHAVRHARQSRHPLVVQVEKPQLRWCFPCSALISLDKFENGEQKDLLSDVVKLLKKQPSSGSAVDVEDVWFGSGSVLSEVKSGSGVSAEIRGRDFYAVRGLMNLGNTCFFNSVLQNILAMGRFQDELLKLGDSTGPLTNSLKKLYAEVNAESGVRNVLNPKSLLGSVCSKAPQFRGYQQQDSHELLLCLLDGLSTEDLRVKKSTNSCPEQKNPSHVNISFVDTIFGGQISSTVCCVECGHSSVVYEPYLDLSLPVPTKKTPPKKAHVVSRNRKIKPPPRKLGKARSKLGNGFLVPLQGDPAPPSESSRSSLPSVVTVEEKGDSVNGDVVDSNGSLLQSGVISASAEFKGTNNFSDAAQHAVCSDESTWMNYAEPLSLEDERDLALVTAELPENQDSERTDFMQNDVTHQNGDEVPNADRQEISADGFDWMDFLEETPAADKQDWAVQPDELLADQDSVITDMLLNNGIHPDLEKCGKEELNVNYYEDEVPLQVGDSEVLLLPCPEEVATVQNFVERDIEPSSSAVGDGDADDMLGYEGFADMFNEPEVVMGPLPNPSAGGDIEIGVLAGKSSESDPDEVDDTDSPVSIESCLTHFTKPELLADEHAWHCENCTKIVLEKRRKVRKKKLKPLSTTQNGCTDNFLTLGVEKANLNNGTAGEEDNHQLTNRFSCASEASAVLQTTGKASLIDDDVSNPSEASAAAQSAGDSSKLAEDSESGESDGEEADSKGVKVMRNATKRILINKLPPSLTIHLKRFNQDARGRLSKLNGHVVFKEFVDLKPYVDSRCPEKQGDCKYRLAGLVEHSGSMRGGHYVAYVRGGDKRRGDESEGQSTNKSVWYYASDAHVRETTLEEVLRCEAYILFYERV